jgi:hypothetical protein
MMVRYEISIPEFSSSYAVFSQVLPKVDRGFIEKNGKSYIMGLPEKRCFYE